MNEPNYRSKDYLSDAAGIESHALTQAYAKIKPETILLAAKALLDAPRIAASGCGHSGIVCQHFAHLMCCIDRPARFLSPAEAMHGASGFLQDGDVLVLVSRGGETSELLPLLPISRQRGVKIIAVTEKTDSPLACGADIVLPIVVTRETDRYNSQGTTSLTVTAVLFHAIQSAVMELSGYRNEQFAVIHPGGAVGKRLNK